MNLWIENDREEGSNTNTKKKQEVALRGQTSRYVKVENIFSDSRTFDFCKTAHDQLNRVCSLHRSWLLEILIYRLAERLQDAYSSKTPSFL